VHGQNDIAQLELEKMLKQKFRTLLTNPLGVLKKYHDKMILRLTGQLQPLYNENYDKHWNYVFFKDKIVLDLGADYGSTASYFLHRGAKRVIAVEGNKQFAEALRENFKKNMRVTPIELFIRSPSDVDDLISQYAPDVVKVDIEGYELTLLQCQNIQKVREWLIECHSREICEQIKSLFLKKGFNVAVIDYGEMVKLSLPIIVLIAVKPFSRADVIITEPETTISILKSKSSNKHV